MTRRGRHDCYAQCKLKRLVCDTAVYQTSWIPLKYAVKGIFLELKTPDGWENGWEVISVGQVLEYQNLPAQFQQSLKTRKVSDI